MSTAIDRRDDSASTLVPPHLRDARFEDYDQIRRLASVHSITLPSFEQWAHRWRQNPLWQRLERGSPIGWVLEKPDGEVVGSMETVPTLYKFRGSDLVCAATALWCVDARYRGFALELLDAYLNQSADLFISTSASAVAFGSVRPFFDPVPIGRWDTTSCYVGNYRAFTHHALQKYGAPGSQLLSYPAGAALRLTHTFQSRLPAKRPSGIAIEWENGFDARFDTFWNELVRENGDTLLAERSSAVLTWHFSRAMRAGRLWILSATKGQHLIAYCVFMELETPGTFKRIRLIDYQKIDNTVDLLGSFISAALRRCAAEGFYVLDHVGAGLPRMRRFDEYATYQRPLGTWMFLFRAADSLLDTRLHEPRFWDPSLFDGDATL